MKIAFIGGGNMGEAMLAALLEKGLSTPQDVAVSDISEGRRSYLKEKYSVAVTASNKEAAGNKDVIVLAVKPQSLLEVMAGLNGQIEKSQLVLSIMAGLCHGLGHRSVVRAMPNTPARVGAGISAWTASDDVSGVQKEMARAILEAMGREIYFDDEKYLDMATAISGSGPAYFFLFVEALISAAVDIGLPPEEAGKLVFETMQGSSSLMLKSDKSPAELCRMVTSPGGTTAAALEQFQKGGLDKLVMKAVRAAYKRARELGK
jgi:pyrroline-5-carboxylate reductase